MKIRIAIFAVEILTFTIAFSAFLYCIGYPSDRISNTINLQVYGCQPTYIRTLVEPNIHPFSTAEYGLIQIGTIPKSDEDNCEFIEFQSNYNFRRLDMSGWDEDALEELSKSVETSVNYKIEHSASLEEILEHCSDNCGDIILRAYSRIFPNLPEHDYFSIFHSPYEYSQHGHKYDYVKSTSFQTIKLSNGEEALFLGDAELHSHGLSGARFFSIRLHDFAERTSLSEIEFRLKINGNFKKPEEFEIGNWDSGTETMEIVHDGIEIVNNDEFDVEFISTEEGRTLLFKIEDKRLSKLKNWIVIFLSVFMGAILSEAMASLKRIFTR